LGLFLILVVAAIATSQEKGAFQMPESGPGKLINEYFCSFNSGDTAAIRQFWETYSAVPVAAPMEERLQRSARMLKTLGTLEPIRMLHSEGNRTSLLVRSQNEGFLSFEFRIEAGPPVRLRGIGIDEADPNEPPPEPRASLAQLASDLDRYLTEQTAVDRFSGVVMIAKGDEIVFHRPYGYADREARIANNTETKFNLGSINKAFTSLGIRQLAAQGKLSLDDTLKKFLPDYPNREAARKVTVRHLLNMSSGIGDIFGDRYKQTPKESLMTIRDFLPLFADLPLSFEPGTQRQYSNGGYLVLGAIIEEVSGLDYYTYARKNIFDPAGMNDTESYPKAASVANRARGYTRRGGGDSLRTNYDTLPGRGSSGGGGYSTTSDMLRYVEALRQAKICEPDDPARQGFGVGGGAPGINAAFDWNPESGFVIIVLTNFDPPTAERVSRRIRGWLPR
jgi:CubicO group peptidase (beta-lactamase class C family)